MRRRLFEMTFIIGKSIDSTDIRIQQYTHLSGSWTNIETIGIKSANHPHVHIVDTHLYVVVSSEASHEIEVRKIDFGMKLSRSAYNQ